MMNTGDNRSRDPPKPLRISEDFPEAIPVPEGASGANRFEEYDTDEEVGHIVMYPVKIIEFTAFLLLFTGVVVLIGLWGWVCEYVVHDIDNFNNASAKKIVLTWVSVLLIQSVMGIFIFLVSLTMMNWPKKHGNRGDQVYKKTLVIMVSTMIMSCSYPVIYHLEVHLLNVVDPPGVWSPSGALYCLSGYLKIVPLLVVMIILRQSILIDTQHKQNSSSVRPEERK